MLEMLERKDQLIRLRRTITENERLYKRAEMEIEELYKVRESANEDIRANRDKQRVYTKEQKELFARVERLEKELLEIEMEKRPLEGQLTF